MIEKIIGEDFVLLSLMNSYLESPCIGDLFYADFFQDAFTRYQNYKHELPTEEQIPKIIHFIWIGKKKFPATSVQNLLSWKALHPDWKMIFWTDRHEAPIPGMEVEIIQSPGPLTPYFDAASNPAERADYLRYDILNRLGGIYVDHDVKCLMSFDDLTQCSSFFAIQSHAFSNTFLYRFGERELKCRFLMDNGILGSKPGCKLWDTVFEAARNTWDFYTDKWKHFEPICVLHRSLLPLTIGIIEYLHHSQDPSICVLPKICQYPQAFSGPLFKSLVKRWSYCQNQHAKSWITPKNRKLMNEVWKATVE